MGDTRPLTSKRCSTVLLLGLLIAAVPGSASALGEGDGLCRDLVPIELHRILRGPLSEVGETHCFTAPIPSPGILTLDVSVPGPAAAEPKLDFLGRICGRTADGWEEARREDFVTIERFPAHLALMVEVAGDYSFCVAAQDPALALAPFKLLHGFLELSPADGDPPPGGGVEDPEDPDEDEIDPNLRVDIPPVVVARGQGDLRPPLAIEGLCRWEDDHGETAACASPLDLDRRAAGEIRNGWGDDEDFFTFLLSTTRTVRIETRGETDTFGGLYDRFGHRLARADDGGRAGNFRIVKTLGPGRYFVRVEGIGGAEGRYALDLRAWDRAP
ncbi:MAG: hypothetical protein GY856_34370 [bacterium]|nr:hypothetical protein [bacterium]